MLTGKDNVDRWSNQTTWDAVLDNIHIVFSTHQVLLDALTHGFVKMSKLALMIFDEAHHCTSKHPANLILANFYFPAAQNGDRTDLPRILGLSASPVQTAKASGNALRLIEENMDATAKTPKIHRSELLRFVHKPELRRVDYQANEPVQSLLLASLKMEVRNYDLKTDPYVVALLAKQHAGHDVSKQLQTVIMSRNTYCLQQLKALLNKADATHEELGASAAEWYLQNCISRYHAVVQASDQQLFQGCDSEKHHLSAILQRLPIPALDHDPPLYLRNISPKVEALVDVLFAELGAHLTGIIFVEQRVWAAALVEILSLHPKLKDRIEIGTFIGSSQSSKKKSSIANLAEPKNQHDTLDKFRAGDTNLIIATSVLEEGIDVSSCHLVICFEKPKNLKSFIQRRGRARKQESKYFIFLPESGTARPPESWEALEEVMKKAYLDDMRQVKLAEEREMKDEEGERFYRIPESDALLTLGNASQHLHHFCSLLSSSIYVDTRPQFEFDGEDGGLITAEVNLPLSINPTLRKARSLEVWSTERMAMKDAAFQAYVALHKAGLVNDNLLPHRQEAHDHIKRFQIPDNTPSLVEVSPAFDPWFASADYQQVESSTYHRTLLKLTGAGKEPLHMVFLTPIHLPDAKDLNLYWSSTKQCLVESFSLPEMNLNAEEVKLMREITRKILSSVFYGRMEEERYDFLWLLVPSIHPEHNSGYAQLSDWHTATSGVEPASKLIPPNQRDISNWGLVSVDGVRRKYIAEDVNFHSEEPCIHGTKVPKRRDFLHPVSRGTYGSVAHSKVEEFAASTCSVANLPSVYSLFALLFPSVLCRYEVHMIANTLRTTILSPLSLDLSHIPYILQAITSSATGEIANYQRFEFLGDCILKLIASTHLMAVKLAWPESFLTSRKSKIVSNGFAACAALLAGLDKFVLTKRLTGMKWAPRYIEDVLALDHTGAERILSSKVLADVVESLIGVSYIIGGFEKANVCVQTLLPLEKWTPIPEANTILFRAAPADTNITKPLPAEKLIGYTFTKKSLLLDSLTHASFTSPNANCSYERLEFLGDAVLDYIITKRLFAHTPELSHQKMHSIRTAMVNAAFLSFRMFETSVSEERTNPSTLQKEIHYKYLWQYLRCTFHELVDARDAAIKQHRAARKQLLQVLDHGNKFPWYLLALSDSPKFLSDIVESVIGAIYVDSHGDFSSCEFFLRKLGILDCLERIVRDEVDCLHPKERLGHLASEKDVQYLKVVDEHQEEDGRKRKLCRIQIQVGGQDVGSVESGLKRRNAETIAAWKAVKILEGAGDVEMDDSEDQIGWEIV